MYQNSKITAIIPAYNEEESLGLVLADIPDFVDRVIVCDNGSTDRTAEVARSGGAEVVSETERGYGAACLKAAEQLDAETDIILFLDGDYSDYPEEAELLLEPIAAGKHDLIIGSRMIKPESARYLTPVARFGNWLSTGLLWLFWGYRFTDLGPFRAISYDSYQKIDMQDRNFGWTVEMQIKAAKHRLRVAEKPVSYRARIGRSKISGTISGSVKAGTKILYLIFRELFTG